MRRFFSDGDWLHQYHGQTVEEQKHIPALVAVLNESPLIGNNEGVLVGILVIYKVHEAGAFLSLTK